MCFFFFFKAPYTLLACLRQVALKFMRSINAGVQRQIQQEAPGASGTCAGWRGRHTLRQVPHSFFFFFKISHFMQKDKHGNRKTAFMAADVLMLVAILPDLDGLSLPLQVC